MSISLGSLQCKRRALGRNRGGMLWPKALIKVISIHKQRWSVFTKTSSNWKYPPALISIPGVPQILSIGICCVLRLNVEGLSYPCLVNSNSENKRDDNISTKSLCFILQLPSSINMIWSPSAKKPWSSSLRSSRKVALGHLGLFWELKRALCWA